MNRIIALVMSTGLAVNIFSGVSVDTKNDLGKIPAKVISVGQIEEKVSQINKEKINNETNYIDFKKINLVADLVVETREDALRIVAEKYELDEGQLTVGKMNNNVYLVNFFDDVEETRIVNLYLVVNGEVIDQKYVEGDEISSTFVENFMKYQEIDPLEEYVEKIIVMNQGKDEKMVAQGIANLINMRTGCPLEEVKVRKSDESSFAADYIKDGKNQKLIIKEDDLIKNNFESVIAGLEN